jgi:hypothetical protein
MPNNFDKRPLIPSVPLGGIPAGNGFLYPDMHGGTHSTPGGAIEANQGWESADSRGASGGCSQDSNRVPFTKGPGKGG